MAHLYTVCYGTLHVFQWALSYLTIKKKYFNDQAAFVIVRTLSGPTWRKVFTVWKWSKRVWLSQLDFMLAMLLSCNLFILGG